MPTVSNTVTDPAGDPIAGVQVVIRLIATIPESTPAAGFLGPDDETILSQVELTTDALGEWSTNLVANDLITPAGTYYLVSERPDVTPRRPAVKYRISVPDGAGPYWAGDLLVNAPDDLPSAVSAAGVSFASTGTISATNVQAAIAEVALEAAGVIDTVRTVEHGAEATTARPDVPAVYWIGSVPPVFGEPQDLYFNTVTLVLSSVGASNFVADTFDRADSATSLGSATTGEAWTALAGTWGIASNKGYCPSGTGAQNNAAIVEANDADVTIEVDIALNANSNAGLCFRAADATNYVFVRCPVSTDQVLLRKLVAGVETGVATASVDLTAGNTITLTVIVAGESVTVKVNGVTCHNAVTVADHAANTKHGLFSREALSRFEDLLIY